MIIGYFDFIILALLIFLNIKFWNTEINWKIGCLMGIIILGIVLPFVSIIIELEVVKATKGVWMDSFEVVYTILRFPTYWIIGIIQAIVIGVNLNCKRRATKRNNEKEN